MVFSMLKKNFFRKYVNLSLHALIRLISNLLIPIIIGILTITLPLQPENLSKDQSEISKIIIFPNRVRSIQALHEEQNQSILTNYQEDLADLILKYNFSTDSTDSENNKRILLIIRIKTLHVLRQIDPATKILLIQLLFDNNIQNQINITHSDLSSLIFPPGTCYNQLQFINILARNISSLKFHLRQSNASYSILNNSLFIDSNCSHADFSHASLQRTDWTNTDVKQAKFDYTNLYKAKII